MQGILLRRNQREALTGFLWISPWLVGFVVFTAGPMLFSLGTSFTRFTLGKTAQFAGLENYVRAFTADPLFWPSLGRTLLFTAVTVGLPARLGSAQRPHFSRVPYPRPTVDLQRTTGHPVIGADRRLVRYWRQ